MVLIRDLSEQLKITEELEALKSSYSALSETVSDPILQINESFHIIFANSAVERVFGYTAGGAAEEGVFIPVSLRRCTIATTNCSRSTS